MAKSSWQALYLESKKGGGQKERVDDVLCVVHGDRTYHAVHPQIEASEQTVHGLRNKTNSYAIPQIFFCVPPVRSGNERYEADTDISSTHLNHRLLSYRSTSRWSRPPTADRLLELGCCVASRQLLPS